MVSSFAAIPTAAQAKPVSGKLAGVVHDAAGTPQMGASVELISEAMGGAATRGFLTNTQSMFASLDQLRRMPSNNTAEGDDWKWVLRSASTMRPVLEWVDHGTLSASTVSGDSGRARTPSLRMEFTDGCRRPSSLSSIASPS